MPHIAGRKPMLATLGKKGERVFWCACGRSKTQPFCDGSHKGTGFTPIPYVAKADHEEVLLCLCKRTGDAPFCDGSHNNLDDHYAEAGKTEIAASSATPITPGDESGLARLDGGAFVLTADPDGAAFQEGWRIAPVIDAARGAQFLSVFLLEAGPAAKALRFPSSEAVIFILKGNGVATIGERQFNIAPECALTLRAGETLSVAPDADRLRALAAICPQTEAFEFSADTNGAFDARRPERVGRVEAGARQAMGDRFYQVLADASTGAEETTLFIGEIPKSRAAAHRHLYEEAIIILSGEGFLWTEDARAAVRPGDILFLPRKQLHSLECTSEDGMRLAGAFYPSGSPAINY